MDAQAQRCEMRMPGRFGRRPIPKPSRGPIFLALAVSLALGGPVAAQSSAVGQIDSLLAEQLPAANAHDAERFLAGFAHDSSLIFVLNGGVLRGYDAVLARQREAWAGGGGAVVYAREAPPEVSLVGPDAAYALDRITARRTLPSGEVRSVDIAVLLVWQRRPEGWRIVAAHESTAH